MKKIFFCVIILFGCLPINKRKIGPKIYSSEYLEYEYYTYDKSTCNIEQMITLEFHVQHDNHQRYLLSKQLFELMIFLDGQGIYRGSYKSKVRIDELMICNDIVSHSLSICLLDPNKKTYYRWSRKEAVYFKQKNEFDIILLSQKNEKKDSYLFKEL